MKLTDTIALNATPIEKPYRLFDGKGLYLEITPKGSKYWRLKYSFRGKEKRLALGVYPEVSLQAARDKTMAARKLLHEYIDPAQIKRQKKYGIEREEENE